MTKEELISEELCLNLEDFHGGRLKKEEIMVRNYELLLWQNGTEVDSKYMKMVLCRYARKMKEI